MLCPGSSSPGYLSGSNFDDEESRLTAGRNGLRRQARHHLLPPQHRRDGRPRATATIPQDMGPLMAAQTPVVTKYKAKAGYVRVRVRPDADRFGGLRDIHLAVQRRVYDLAATTPARVRFEFNGAVVPVKGWVPYAKLYLGEATPIVHQDDHFQVCVAGGPRGYRPDSRQFRQRRRDPPRGGPTCAPSRTASPRSSASASPPSGPAWVKDRLSILVACNVVNPTFSSQTKEELTTSRAQLRTPPPEVFERITKKPFTLVERLNRLAQSRDDTQAAAQTRCVRKSQIQVPKLDDALDAGTTHNEGTALILTEGDSAKVCAVNGVTIVGRRKFGVFPLKGKLVNALKGGQKAVLANEELRNVMRIVGLQLGKTYKSLAELRYRRIIALTDADADGKHICGLLVAFVHHFWPELVQMGLLCTFVTPVVKATVGSRTISWYNHDDFLDWQRQHPQDAKKAKIRYYKGLGTSSHEESKQYFRDYDANLKPLQWTPRTDEALHRMFSDKCVNDRKRWIAEPPLPGLDCTRPHFEIDTYVDRELAAYCREDLHRSLPHVMDGLKVSQRKVLWAVMRRNLTDYVKVSQLAGHVSEVAGYHHGEASLAHAIVSMNQCFVGKNQIALLQQHGNFGTRLRGGHDAASERYITTRMADVTRKLYPAADDPHLTTLLDDGHPVEPQFYVGVLPMLLINEVYGIGTGWSAHWPPHHTPDVVANVLRWIQQQPLVPLTPHYPGFTGACHPVDDHKYVLHGTIQPGPQPTQATITELPPHRWIDDVKDKLSQRYPRVDSLGDVDKPHLVVHHPDAATRDAWIASHADGLAKENLSVRNTHAFDVEGRVQHYQDPLQVLVEHATVRMELYRTRQQALVRTVHHELQVDAALAQFLAAVVDRRIDLAQLADDDAVRQAVKIHCPDALPHLGRFLDTPLRSITRDKVSRVNLRVERTTHRLALAQGCQPHEMWLYELSLLPNHLLGHNLSTIQLLLPHERRTQVQQAIG